MMVWVASCKGRCRVLGAFCAIDAPCLCDARDECAIAFDVTRFALIELSGNTYRCVIVVRGVLACEPFRADGMHCGVSICDFGSLDISSCDFGSLDISSSDALLNVCTLESVFLGSCVLV